jgi:hypothetical protein
MTSKRVMAGFAAGAALAGMVVGAARLSGVVEPAMAFAEEPAPVRAVPARQTRAETPAPDLSRREKERWRGKSRASSDVPAGVLARVASRRELERGGRCPAPKEERAAPLAVADADAERCQPEGDGIESVEIEWNGASATP